MTYTILAGAGVVVAVIIDFGVLRTKVLRRKAFWLAYVIVLGFQLVVNGLLTGLPIVRYDRDAILGWRVAYAPVEDLFFGLALVTITLSAWVWLGARALHRADR